MGRSIACSSTLTLVLVSEELVAFPLHMNPWLEWVSADKGNTVQWSTSQTSQVAYHSVELEQPQAFTEAYNQASDGTAFYAMSLVSVNMTPRLPVLICSSLYAQGSGQSTAWQTCQDTVCYNAFFGSGALNSKNDDDTFRPIST